MGKEGAGGRLATSVQEKAIILSDRRSCDERDGFERRIRFNIRTRVSLFPSVTLVREAWRIERRSLTAHQYEKPRGDPPFGITSATVGLSNSADFRPSCPINYLPYPGAAARKLEIVARPRIGANQICILFKRPAVIEPYTMPAYASSANL